MVFLLFAFTLFLKADSLESNLSQNEIEKIEKADISLEEIIKKAITYGSFLKNSSLIKTIHPAPVLQIEQPFDLMI